MDLQVDRNRKQWEQALDTCVDALNRNWLDDWQIQFVTNMRDLYQLNGTMMEPTVKQFNQLRQIAFEMSK